MAELIRRVRISEQTFYLWKKQYIGLEVDQVRQLKELQEKNNRLKRVVADLTLDKAMLQDVLSKNSSALGIRTMKRDSIPSTANCKQLRAWKSTDEVLK